jgi:hypothetical protein
MASRLTACCPDRGSMRSQGEAQRLRDGGASTARVYVANSGDFFCLSGIMRATPEATTTESENQR